MAAEGAVRADAGVEVLLAGALRLAWRTRRA
jgi:hypothetical protein